MRLIFHAHEYCRSLFLLDWFVLAIYLTWTLVMVHFAAGIYVCVCFYYTAARSEEQESIRAHNVEMEEHPDNIEL